jgi:hypothetical protein
MIIMNEIKAIALEYINQTDDEVYLYQLLLDKDYYGRDTLEMIRQLDLLELIQEPKVEAII